MALKKKTRRLVAVFVAGIFASYLTVIGYLLYASLVFRIERIERFLAAVANQQ